jgi:cell division protein FtsZ
MGDEIRVTVIAAGFDEVTPRTASKPSSFSAANSGAIPIVPTPAYEQEEVQTSTISGVPAWFGTSDIEPEQEVAEPVREERASEEQNRPFNFEQRRNSSNFDDGMDIPDFLK